MSNGIDASELTEFGRHIALAAVHANVKIAKSVKKGAQNVKESVQEDLARSSNSALQRISIGYDMGSIGTQIYADISPREGGASALANIAFFGTAKGGGTHQFYEHAEAEVPVLADYVADAGVEAIGEVIGL
ncbi:hypothetical protein D2E25_0247 [Bifidobacterium goeldii]|uniref:HK97 gp10 family phage protein n=1 Tax=Bifidobacterium goeldii TaxID=2306975 RepID=A0A430FML6_9BIFI|nr:hypothetical protein [Bifidobacterium goeldii]RSX53941.1 hypothetical protein D2E25_0247 [Bifidobacterium goeldii]